MCGCCPQERLAAAEARSQASPPASTHKQLLSGDAELEQQLRELQRKLGAKHREAEAAGQALAAKQQQLQQREAELEQERARVAALGEEVARWRDECMQVGAEVCEGNGF